MSIYNESRNTVPITNKFKYKASPEEREQDEKKLRAQMREYFGNKENESMKEAREIYAKEVENAKGIEKAEEKRKRKCKKELRGCYMNCKAPGYRSKYDCDKCTDKIFDRVRAVPSQSACDDNTVSHYKADCDRNCKKSGTVQKIKARLGNKRALEELKKMGDYTQGTYGDDLPQDQQMPKLRVLPGFNREQARERVRGLWGDGGNETAATGGARRRRRTKRRKPKKSKKSKRTRRRRR